ncbi:MAG: helix-turn-helix domain-containing protein [Myxococcota bacterium]
MVRPRRHTDEQLLDAARRVFVAHGPRASLQRIADEVGLSQPALLKRFGTKEALLTRALAPELLPRFDLLAAGPDDRPIAVQLREFCVGALGFFAIALPCWLAVRAAGAELSAALAADALPHKVRAALTGFLTAARDQGRIRAVDPAQTASWLIAGLEGRATVAHLLGEPFELADREAHADVWVDLLWRGVAP